ncbi:GNAT family N-acetyltransferase [Streptomyces subrutilus]|uniref:N-acetyltransferase n=1 Tax=Streptomyces subrutilus TaxID=36818 RepID=A0A5P2UK25_9ACTN|nr:GNAT family protein [Streptomyces subrutilus]QEU77844.1 N-acetyltransferase [Streptomyces subrutilus]WSJ33015.1 GNAT family N-acetyltransferase [Streptomyces subrutilus]GGZ62737.1 N-acetyltransferase [Streptomyces subrutilus]
MTLFGHPLDENAQLRPLEPWNAVEFAEYVDRDREHLGPWLPWAHAITDSESARKWLQAYAERQARDEGRIFGIWLDGKLQGGALFRTFDVPSGVCELGAWLSPEAGGRGLVTRAADRLVRWALDERGMTRVEWRVTPANKRSIAVAERLGMRHEGTLRQVFPFNGVRQDLEIWALLAADRG